MQTSVIKPGLLVSLSIRVKGGVNYTRTELEAEHRTDDGEQRARWETEKVITDAAEYERAEAARSAAGSLIRSACCKSAFGLLCPSENADKLAEAISKARAIADAHNASAALTRLEVYALVGRVAQDDAEAARAIAGEVRGLLDMMAQAIKVGDVEAIREAANKARSIGGMLSEDVAARVDGAISEARRVAREIVRRVEKGAETAADVVKGIKLQAIDAARFAFLDVDAGQAQPIAPTGRDVEVPAGDDTAPGDAQAAPLLAAQPALEF